MKHILAFLFAIYSTSVMAHYHDINIYPAWKHGEELGQLEFHSYGETPASYPKFITGMKSLHSYEFSEAIYSFREAQHLNPNYFMAYWGEAMANFMLVWHVKNLEEARQALKHLHEHIDVNDLPNREKMLLTAIEALAGEAGQALDPDDKNSHVWAFRRAMAAVYARYPANAEIGVWYGYAILATRHGIRDYVTQDKAAEYFEAVLKEHPDHPGALHYLIHAYENPAQSAKAKKAAQAVENKITGAIHMLHMPAHYYITVADWDKVIDINHKAWNASMQRKQDLQLTNASLEYHGFSWVIYAHLQKGEPEQAFAALQKLNQYRLPEAINQLYYVIRGRANFLAGTDPKSKLWQQVASMKLPYEHVPTEAVAADLTAKAYSAFRLSDKGQLMQIAADYQQMVIASKQTLSGEARDAIAVNHMQIKAMGLALDGQQADATALLNQAIAKESTMLIEHGVPLTIVSSKQLLIEAI